MGIFSKIRAQFVNNGAFHGEIDIVASAFLLSLFPIFSKLTFATVPPLFTAALSTLVAGAFFAVVVTVRKEWSQIKVKSSWKDILLTTMIIGVVYYSLLFIGMQKTSAGNASIITTAEVFFSMTILGMWKKERLRKKYIFGTLLMAVGAFAVLFPGRLHLNEGDVIILVASAIPPVGNYFAQKAREQVGSNMIMFIRSTLSGIFIFLMALLFEPMPGQESLVSAAYFILINGLLLLGLSKILWIEGIHRIPITKANALNSIAPAFTLLFAFFLIGEMPSIWQFLGFLPMLIGIFLLTEYKRVL
jgi:drug/metabolite transporter (DMT)-like permease